MKKSNKENIDQNIPEDNNEKPKIFGIRKKSGIKKDFSRRDFIGLGLAVTAGALTAGSVTSCGSDDNKKHNYERHASQTCRSVKTFAHNETVNSIALNSDIDLLVSGSDDCTVKLWKLSDGTLLKTLTAHTEQVKAVAISPDGKFLVSAPNDSDENLKLWSLPDGTFQANFGYSIENSNSLAFTPDSLIIAAVDTFGISLWNIDDYSLNRSFEEIAYSSYYCVAISRDGTMIAAGTGSGSIQIWEIQSGTLKITINTGSIGYIKCVAFCPDGSVISGDNYGYINIWNSITGSLLKTLKEEADYSGEVKSLYVSFDGTFLAAVYSAFVVKLWNLSDGSLIRSLEVSNSHNSVVLNSAGTILALAGKDKIIELWDVSKGELKKVFLDPGCTGETNWCNSVPGPNCSCDSVCSCDEVCSCDSVCTCNTVCSCDSEGGGGGGYWYPN